MNKKSSFFLFESLYTVYCLVLPLAAAESVILTHQPYGEQVDRQSRRQWLPCQVVRHDAIAISVALNVWNRVSREEDSVRLCLARKARRYDSKIAFTENALGTHCSPNHWLDVKGWRSMFFLVGPRFVLIPPIHRRLVLGFGLFVSGILLDAASFMGRGLWL